MADTEIIDNPTNVEAVPTIPDETAKPVAAPQREYVPDFDNLAKSDKLSKKVADVIVEYLRKFKSQPQRKKLETDMAIADRMWRVSMVRDRTDATDQQENTLSNVASTSFFKAHRIITSGQRAIMFYGEELPVKIEVKPGGNNYQNDVESERVTKERNLLLRHYFDSDKAEKKIKESLFFNNKYAQEMLSIEWDYRTEEVNERVPIIWDAQGRPVAYDFMKSIKTVADDPTLCRTDLKDIWFDCQIDDMQQQCCIIKHFKNGIDYFYQKQRDLEYVNVGKIKSEHMYRQEPTGASGLTVLEERQENASEDVDIQPTGLIDGYHVWVRLPIDDKGRYNAKRQLPRWFEFVFAGNLEGDWVCVQGRRNMRPRDTVPYNLIHSHMDDKGAIHDGYATLLKCLYEEETTTINEMIDNKTLRTRAPWKAWKGSVLSRNLKFRNANQVIWMANASPKEALEKVDVPDTTASTLPFLDRVSNDFQQTAGTDKAISGEFAGARTTSTEYQGVMNQAMKPALEDAEYVADQIFPWLADEVISLYQFFGDPKRTIAITHTGQTEIITPATLYGDFKTKIVSIGQFESDVLRRNQITAFVAAFGPLAIPAMGKRGSVAFFKDAMRYQNFENVDKYFPTTGNYEAEQKAWAENMLMLWQGGESIPKPEEDHETHLGVHKPYLDNYSMLPEGEQDPARVQRMQLHIQMHEQMVAQAEKALTAAAQPQIAGGTPNAVGSQVSPEGAPMMPQQNGEAAGDMMGGMNGGLT